MKVLKEKHISYSSSKKPLEGQKTKKQQEAEMADFVFSELAKMAMKGISKNESSDDEHSAGVVQTDCRRQKND